MAPIAHFRAAVAAIILIVALCLQPRVVQAVSHAAPLPQPAECVTVITAAMSRNGALYSQGGYLASDPINPTTGKPYPRTGPTSFDCSGLVLWSYAQAGITVGSTTYQQINNGVQIPCTLADLNGDETVCWAAGDLLFLRYPEGQHVAIYVGAGTFFGCENYALGCLTHNPKTNTFYQRYFWQARRIITGCGDDTAIDPADPLPVDAQPTWETIPGIAGPVRLVLPWFEPGGPVAIEPLPEPTFASYDVFGWLQWMGVQLYNRISIPVVYWMLAGVQSILNAVQAIINTVIVPSLNWFWRIIVRVVLWFNAIFLVFWSVFEDTRYYIWNIYNGITQELTNLLATFNLIQQLIDIVVNIISLIGGVVMAVVNAVVYIITILVSSITYLIDYAFAVLLGDESYLYENARVTEVTESFIFVVFIDALNGIVDSKLGWFYYACVSLFYARLVMWLLEEASSANS